MRKTPGPLQARLTAAPRAQCRPVLNRLELLAELLRAVPVSRAGAGEGFQLEALMRFVGAAVGSPSADVRAAAVRVAAQVPPPLRAWLPQCKAFCRAR